MKNLPILLLLAILLFSCGEDKDCCVLPMDEVTYSFAEMPANGCSNFYVYKQDDDTFLHLYVTGSRKDLNLDLTEQTVSATDKRLTVAMHEFDGPIGSYACDDAVGDEGTVKSTWRAIDGEVLLQIVEDSIDVQPWETTYRLNIKLQNVQLESETGESGTLEDTEFIEVLVGWLPG